MNVELCSTPISLGDGRGEVQVVFQVFIPEDEVHKQRGDLEYPEYLRWRICEELGIDPRDLRLPSDTDLIRRDGVQFLVADDRFPGDDVRRTVMRIGGTVRIATDGYLARKEEEPHKD